MPQMMPLNWLILSVLFTIIFLIFNSQNYFSFIYTPKTKINYMKKTSINWKW
uniref:ATP synthase complex subunit 8 n=1 Tax=Scaphidium quadrimaculatum TaxID=295644 RepID=A0A0S2M8F5_SCAQU|nr:ATP synthase F0 subunit 8 [Scaphidium quadrimaculatum]ALO70892.1 ATP synthase F0 subunit 8 [Scaphidium quadrimaculatum]